MRVHSFDVTAINLNDAVGVRLTARGVQILAQARERMGAPEPGACVGEMVPFGYHRFQLWDLMLTFGPHLGPGFGPPPFELDDIFLIEPLEKKMRKGGGR